MPKLLLKFHAAVIKEIPLENTPFTIGRKSDNDLVIDNMSISGHHARITLQGNSYMIEDLQSTNGTYLNEKRVLSAALRHEDQVVLGQHVIVFVAPELAAQPSAPAAQQQPAPEATVVMKPGSTAVPEPAEKFPPKKETAGVLRVIDGKADQGEYPLSALLTYIGKSENAAIKIKGLFAPDIAALISKRPTGYIISAVKEGYPKLNGSPLSGQADLADNDVIEVGGIKFLFLLKEETVNPGKK